MPIGIGGIGDIVALLGIVRGFASALDGSRGSAAEYQEVRRELDGLEQALLCHHQLLQARCQDPALNLIFQSTQSTAEDCQRCIEAFSQQTVKFDRSLGVGKGGNVCRDVTMKVRWQMSKTDEVARFRAELAQHISTLNMLFGMASLNMQRVTNEKIDTKLDAVEEKIDCHAQAQQSKIAKLQDHVDKGNTETAVAIKSVKEDLKLGWLHQLGSELKGIVSQIFTMSGTTLSAVQRIEQRLPSQSEMALISTFTLEDALGRITRIDMMFVSSWDAFDAMLEGCFRDYPGHNKVARKEYVFQDQKTNKEIKRTIPLPGAFKSGQYINMGLLFRKRSSKTKRFWCPYCHLALTQSQEGLIPCKCGNSHQRRMETINVNEEDEIPAFDLPEGPAGELEDLQEPEYLQNASMIATVSEEQPESSSKAQEDMSCFKRVIVVEVQMNIIKTQRVDPVIPSLWYIPSDAYDSSDENLRPLPRRYKRQPFEDTTSYSPRYTSSGSYATPDTPRYQSRNTTKNYDTKFTPRYNSTGVYATPATSRYSSTGVYATPASPAQYATSSAYHEGYYPGYVVPRGWSSYDTGYYYDSTTEDDLAQAIPPRRRQANSTPQRPSVSRPVNSKNKSPPVAKATEADARKHRIPPGHSLNHWDPAEEPIIIFGSVFDCNSLGKWIYEWTVYHHGAATPFSDMASELWILLKKLARNIQRAEDCFMRVRTQENKEMLEDFIDSGERLLLKFKKILNACDTPILNAALRGRVKTVDVKTEGLIQKSSSSEDSEMRQLEDRSECSAESETSDSVVLERFTSASILLDNAPEASQKSAKVEEAVLQENGTSNTITADDNNASLSVDIIVPLPPRIQLGKNAGTEFVDMIFGRDSQLEYTEKFMSSVRLWLLRFDANCEDILRRPSQ